MFFNGAADQILRRCAARLIHINRPPTESPTLDAPLPRIRLRDSRAERMRFIWIRLDGAMTTEATTSLDVALKRTLEGRAPFAVPPFAKLNGSAQGEQHVG